MDLCKLTRHSQNSNFLCQLPPTNTTLLQQMIHGKMNLLLSFGNSKYMYINATMLRINSGTWVIHIQHTASLKLKHETPYTQNWKKVSPFLKLGNIPQIPPAISTYCAKHTWWCQQCQTPTAQSQKKFKRIVNSPAHLWICETIIIQAKETRDLKAHTKQQLRRMLHGPTISSVQSAKQYFWPQYSEVDCYSTTYTLPSSPLKLWTCQKRSYHYQEWGTGTATLSLGSLTLLVLIR